MPVQIKFKDIIINGKATCKALLSIFAIVVLFFSCKSADNDMGDAVARVYDGLCEDRPGHRPRSLIQNT